MENIPLSRFHHLLVFALFYLLFAFYKVFFLFLKRESLGTHSVFAILSKRPTGRVNHPLFFLFYLFFIAAPKLIWQIKFDLLWTFTVVKVVH